ncbi:NINE protein [Cyanobacterium stanieri LEGE 03274]|uniref:NINE protein n=1 Tax=Cyanobacterium stanieri LEGE 03274 TaxID=1828756 RepID=A0ABR9V1M2_9CHRO|nr:NINE protein [Cyanobacterium stanieri]MBE9221788.1 NINE protein [Cyanobacterium stanieri LEGE 03274]
MQSSTNPVDSFSKKKIISIILAFLGTISPLGGLHKFYLGQPIWGVLYLVLGWNSPLVKIACAVDVVLYLLQSQDMFSFNSSKEDAQGASLQQKSLVAQNTVDVVSAIRELESLRQEGLISEFEFEQKRRGLLE